jgi:hypothetical protein
MSSTGVVVNNRSMNGIISYDDGNGGVLEDGQLTAQHSDTDTSDVTHITIEENLNLQGTITANSLVITPLWVSYLYGLVGNIQDQFNGLVISLLGSNNTWTGTNTFNNTVSINSNLGVTGAITGTTITNINSNIALKAPINNPTFTGTVNGITKSMVGLGNVDNTSDVNKPISTATQNALDLKVTAAGGTLSSGIADKLYVKNLAGGAISFPANTMACLTTNKTAGGGELNIVTSNTNYPFGRCCSWETYNGSTYDMLMILSKQGLLTVTGNIVSPTITTINSNIALKQDIISSTNRLGADLVGTGVVSNTEYNYLDGVTSSIQTQLDTKAPASNPTFTGTLKCSAIESSGTTLSIDASNYITMQGGNVFVSNTGEILSTSYSDNTATNKISSTGITCNNVDATGHVYATDGGFGTLSATGATTLGYPVYWGSQTAKLTGPTTQIYTTNIPNVILCQGSGTINITMPKNSHTQLIILDNVNVSVSKQTSDLNFSSFVNVANVSTSSSPKTFSSTAVVNLYYVTNGLSTYIYWAKPTLSTTP